MIMPLWLTLIITLAALALIMLLSSFYFSWLMQKLLYNNVDDLEYVYNNGTAPDRWQRRFLKKAIKAGKIEPEAQKRQTRKNLRKLEKLIKFAGTTRFMEDENTRKMYLRQLDYTKREWQDTLID